MPDRSRPFWSRTSTTSTTPVAIYLPAEAKEVKIWVDADSYVGRGSTYTAPAVAAVNGITTIDTTGAPTAGTFTLTVFPGQGNEETTGALTYDESAADVKTALVALNAFETGDITAGGGALPTAITLTWTAIYAGTAPPLIATPSLTGGGMTVIVTTAPKGNGGYGYVEADAQEVWTLDRGGHRSAPDTYLYVAALTGTGNYRVTAYA